MILGQLRYLVLLIVFGALITIFTVFMLQERDFVNIPHHITHYFGDNHKNEGYIEPSEAQKALSPAIPSDYILAGDDADSVLTSVDNEIDLSPETNPLFKELKEPADDLADQMMLTSVCQPR